MEVIKRNDLRYISNWKIMKEYHLNLMTITLKSKGICDFLAKYKLPKLTQEKVEKNILKTHLEAMKRKQKFSHWKWHLDQRKFKLNYIILLLTLNYHRPQGKKNPKCPKSFSEANITLISKHDKPQTNVVCEYTCKPYK